jgi:hypothetical protein
LLFPAALDNLRSLGKLSAIEVEVVYHFVLVDAGTRITRTTVKKGDAFDRLILRAFEDENRKGHRRCTMRRESGSAEEQNRLD